MMSLTEGHFGGTDPRTFNLRDVEILVENIKQDALPLVISEQALGHLTQLGGPHEIPVQVAILATWVALLSRWNDSPQVALQLQVGRKESQESHSMTVDIVASADDRFAQLLVRLRSELRQVGGIPLADGRNMWMVARNADTRVEVSVGPMPSGMLEVGLRSSEESSCRPLEVMRDCWGVLLTALVADPSQPVGSLEILTPAERDRVTCRLNEKEAPFPENALIHALFEEQAARIPQSVAVLEGYRSVSFAQLNNRANQIAHLLLELGLQPDDLVAVCMERGVDYVAGTLAVLKAGGAYVPLDPSYPIDRLSFMLADARPRLVLTQRTLMNLLSYPHARVVAVDEDARNPVSMLDSENISSARIGIRPDNLAYVIYTSGSTGRPKGAMNEHRGMVNRIVAQRYIEAFSPGDVCCQKTSISFVDAVFEVFGALCNGLPLVILSAEDARNPVRLAAKVKDECVTRLITVPSFARAMLESAGTVQDLAGLRSWTLSGEPVAVDLLKRLQQQLPGCVFINQYGSSEVSSDVACYRCETVADFSVPVGRPVPNVKVYILDSQGRPLPTGSIGEMYVSGAGLARGYVNRPDLTADRYVANPFSSGARMYRMGDLGRWRPDGLLECWGRRDNQVKIRGVRVEPGEIESQLLQHPGVREAVVVARPDNAGGQQLVAYVTLIACKEPNAETQTILGSIQSHLRSSLPSHMIPAAVVRMHELPRTPSGKLNRLALPSPGPEAYATAPYESPQGETEQQVARIWQELLGRERVGRKDNFFELGGHSLLSVSLLERLDLAGFTTDLRSLFATNSLADFAGTVIRKADRSQSAESISIASQTVQSESAGFAGLDPAHLKRIARATPGGAANIEDIYPLAPLQEGILFHHLMSRGEADPYIIPILFEMASAEKLLQLIDALQRVITRHGSLRTAILWDGLPRSMQVVCRAVNLNIESVTLDQETDALEQIKRKTDPQSLRIDLQRPPLLRLQIADDRRNHKWYASLQIHHLICDHQSLEILLAEIAAIVDGREAGLPEPLTYKSHVMDSLKRSQSHAADEFFRTKLGDVEETTAPFDLHQTTWRSAHIDSARKPLPATLSERVRAQAIKFNTSPAAVFHAAWGLVVSCTSGRDDIVFGSVLLGRLLSRASVERAVGLFINTLPVRLKITALTAAELMNQTRDELINLLAHEQTPLSVAQGCSAPSHSQPLFSSILNCVHSGSQTSADERSYMPGISIKEISSLSNYPLAVTVEESGKGHLIRIEVDGRVQASRVMQYMETALISLVHALETAPHSPAHSLSVIPAAEREQVVVGFNRTAMPYPHSQRIHELFEQQARQIPDAVAIKYGSERLTYREINQSANQLAGYLRACGTESGELVPIVMPRSSELVIAQLAILKSGATYVPLDPQLPEERLRFILADCRARRVLSTEGPRVIEGAAVQWIRLPEMTEKLEQFSSDDVHVPGDPEHAAYVMFTSGSTGTPKGVLVSHRGVNRLVINNRFEIAPSDCIAHCSNPGFDAATFEIWGALLNGAAVAVVRQDTLLDPKALNEYLLRQQVSIMWLTVGLFTHYLDSLADAFGKLRCLITGGDAVDPAAFSRVMGSSSPPRHLFNGYGPTEATTFATAYLAEDSGQFDSVPIGSPIANTQIYILDLRMRPVPIGVRGEIYIGGPGVALGYLNRPEETQQRFVDDPFDEGDSNARLYRTGDLGRWRSDGNVEFMGRLDGQVKLRGYRIEVGEVEAQLLRFNGIGEAVVLVRRDENAEKRLVAYVTARKGNEANPEALRTHLTANLPEYMVPSAFVVLDRLPLTANGKVDRKALPAPETAAHSTAEYESPQTSVEQTIAQIWQSVLHLKQVGRGDHFFKLGGHSLVALRTIVRINESIGCSLTVGDAYRYPMLRDLASRAVGEEAAAEELDPLAREATLDDSIRGARGLYVSAEDRILLTGCTGFVGRFLLARLLRETDATMYCLTRGTSKDAAMTRVKSTLVRWNLWNAAYEKRLVGVPGNLGLPNLGLDEYECRRLGREIDCIYHCATSMNHLESYAMAFPVNVTATRELLRMTADSRLKTFNYVSTASIFGPQPNRVRRVVNELTPIDAERHLRSDGYSSSKWMGEKLVQTAIERGIPCNILRLGLVWPDSEKGRYDALQREYRIFKSCLLSGMAIRDYRYEVEPLPVDHVAAAIVALARRHRRGGRIFHLASMKAMTPGLFERCNDEVGTSFELVTLWEWIREIKRLHQAGGSIPAVPLIEFAFSMDREQFDRRKLEEDSASVRLDCTRTYIELSRLGLAAPAFDAEYLRRYVENFVRWDTDFKGSPQVGIADTEVPFEARRGIAR